MLLVLWTLYSVSAFAFRAVSTKSCGFCLCLGRNLQFEFSRAGRQGDVFRFPWIGCNGLPEYYCTRYELESIAVRAVSCSCWGFWTCFFFFFLLRVKQNISSKKKAKRSHSLFGGVAIVNPGKEIEMRPRPVS